MSLNQQTTAFRMFAQWPRTVRDWVRSLSWMSWGTILAAMLYMCVVQYRMYCESQRALIFLRDKVLFSRDRLEHPLIWSPFPIPNNPLQEMGAIDGLTIGEGSALTSDVCKAIPDCPELRYIYFDGPNVTITAELIEAIHRSSSVILVGITGEVRFDPPKMETGSRKLDDLILNKLIITTEFVHGLPNWTDVDTLRIQDAELSDEAARHLARKFPRVKNVRVFNCRLGPNAVAAFSSVQNKFVSRNTPLTESIPESKPEGRSTP